MVWLRGICPSICLYQIFFSDSWIARFIQYWTRWDVVNRTWIRTESGKLKWTSAIKSVYSSSRTWGCLAIEPVTQPRARRGISNMNTKNLKFWKMCVLFFGEFRPKTGCGRCHGLTNTMDFPDALSLGPSISGATRLAEWTWALCSSALRIPFSAARSFAGLLVALNVS